MKTTLPAILVLFLSVNLMAQAPQKMSYQAVIRNNIQALVTNTQIGMRTSILQGDFTGPVVYSEVYNPNPTTNANGLVSLEIGSGTAVSGNFSAINWANGPYFIKIETDITGGTNYDIVSTKELLSVPYALHAANSVNYTEGQGIKLNNGTISLDKQSASVGQILKYDGLGWTPGSDNVGPAYTQGQGIDLTGNSISLAKQNAQVGQVLKWNGMGWAPGVDSNSNSATTWSVNGGNIYRKNGYVGIGTNDPQSGLDIRLINKYGSVRITDEFVDTFFRTSLIVRYDKSAKTGVGINVAAGKDPFKFYTFNEFDFYSVANGHNGILAAGDDAGVVGTGLFGVIGIGRDGGKFYGKEVGLSITSDLQGLIIFTPPDKVGANIFGKLWVQAEPFEMFSSNPNVIFPVSTYYESTENAGYYVMWGPNGNPNLVCTHLSGKPNNGYLTIFNGTAQKAGMYLNASNQGVLFADIKNFRMKHPTKPGKEIWYASLEGPEAAAYIRGSAELKNGEATIEFTEDFQIVSNSTTMTVILTPGSADSKGLAVISKSDKGFKVKELFQGNGNYTFDWEVKCVRKGYEDYKVIRDESETKLGEVNRRK